MSQDLLVDPSCNNQTSGCLLKIGVNTNIFKNWSNSIIKKNHFFSLFVLLKKIEGNTN